MKRYLFAFLLVVVSLCLFAETQAETNKKKIVSNLKRIEDTYFKYLSFQERREAIAILDETMKMIQSAEFVTKPDDKNSEGNVLSEEGLQNLLKDVMSTIDEDNKTTMILAIGKKGKITCSQLRKLIETYKFDSYKVKLIKAIYPHILDPVNITLITTTISSSLTRSELEKYLADL